MENENSTAKRTHASKHNVRCVVKTSFTGWSDRVKKAKELKVEPDASFLPIEHVVIVDYSALTREQLEIIASKSDVITFQGTLKRKFENGEDFREFLEGDGSEYEISTKNVGSTESIVSEEQLRKQRVAAAKSLGDEELMAILAARAEENKEQNDES